jgi:hypothetical protein
VDLGPFQQVLAFTHALEIVQRHKPVFAAVFLAGAGSARGAGDGKQDGGVLGKQGLHEAGLAGAAGRDVHEDVSGSGVHE